MANRLGQEVRALFSKFKSVVLFPVRPGIVVLIANVLRRLTLGVRASHDRSAKVKKYGSKSHSFETLH